MIDPSFDGEIATITSYPPTMQELERKIVDMQANIDTLESKLWDMTASMEYHRLDATRYSNYINSFENALKENSWDFDADTMNDLASYFDINLEREYTVDITVRFSGTVTIPIDYDIDNLENDLNASIVINPYGNSELCGDFGEDEMNIRISDM
jgi:hypothetical protein